MLSATKGMLGRLPTLKPWAWGVLFASLFGIQQLHALHLEDRLYFWMTTLWQGDERAVRGIGLPGYRVQVDARPVIGVEDNLSGLTYDDHRDQLWAVVNNPEQLVALSKEGELLARYPLANFSDVEGVTYLGDGLLLLAEERRHSLVVVPVPQAPGSLYREDYRALTLSIDAGDNDGFEGLGYDRAGDRLFVVKEHSPRKLYEVRGLKRSVLGDFGLEVIDHEDWIDDDVFATDLASVHFDERTGHLLLLGEESKLLMELDGQGEAVNIRSLIGGFAGLKESVPQGEGMTLDDQGNLYLVSEPNLFYRMARDSATADQPDPRDDQG